MYAMFYFRPDSSHASSVVSRYMVNSSKEHWNAVQWIFIYLWGTPSACLQFGKSRDGLIDYIDSDYAGGVDKRRSLTGYIFTIGDYAVGWKASLHATVALSTIEAGYIAISEAQKKLIGWEVYTLNFAGFLLALLYIVIVKVLFASLKIRCHERTKHIDVRYHFIQDVIAEGDVKVCKISTHDNPWYDD